ncbi:MAG: beta-ketoacyl-[acyl-carrier-protein] synthase family protein [Lacipirellulaceae bacterium]
MTAVLVTGLGVVSPIGIGVDSVAASLRDGRSGVRRLADLERAGWGAPFGGEVPEFDPKAHVEPRKSLKVMARETQLAFAAAELAWADTGLEPTDVDPERLGVIGAAGMLYCAIDELAGPMATSRDGAGGLDLRAWGATGMRELFPLWMLKYLPNMAACHVGIRRDARGPTNTIALGDVSGLLAIAEAADAIRRGAADVMLAGGASTRLDLTDMVFRGGAGATGGDVEPAAASRPFDVARNGSVMAEGAAYFVLESEEHFLRTAARRGVRPWGRFLAASSRCEPSAASRRPTGRAIEASAAAALASARIAARDLTMVKAHGASRIDADATEAQALARVVGDAPVTAPTSYFGAIGSAGGAVELAAALVAWREGYVPATLNLDALDPACPVNASPEHRDAAGNALLAVNHAPTGQAVAVVFGVA